MLNEKTNIDLVRVADDIAARLARSRCSENQHLITLERVRGRTRELSWVERKPTGGFRQMTETHDADVTLAVPTGDDGDVQTCA